MEAYILQNGEGRAIGPAESQRIVKADAAQTQGQFSLVETTGLPGSGPPLHIHHDAAEAFYVLNGEFDIFLPSGEVHCPAGAFIFIPAGIEHGFRVGAVPSRKLNLYVPAAMVGYFDEIHAAAGSLNDAALSALAVRYSMEVTGPVPEGYV